MTQPTALEAAQQGNPSAIAALMNRTLQPKGITAKAAFSNGYLQVRLESVQPRGQTAMVEFVRKGLTGLQVKDLKSAKVSFWMPGEEFPTWSDEIQFQPAAPVVEVKDESRAISVESPAKPAGKAPTSKKVEPVKTTTTAPAPDRKKKVETPVPTPVVLACLLLFAPAGLVMMWAGTTWQLRNKLIASVAAAPLCIFSLALLISVREAISPTPTRTPVVAVESPSPEPSPEAASPVASEDAAESSEPSSGEMSEADKEFLFLAGVEASASAEEKAWAEGVSDQNKVKMAKSACGAFGRGVSFERMVLELYKQTKGNRVGTIYTSRVIGAGVGAFCPEHLSKIPNSK